MSNIVLIAGATQPGFTLVHFQLIGKLSKSHGVFEKGVAVTRSHSKRKRFLVKICILNYYIHTHYMYLLLY